MRITGGLRPPTATPSFRPDPKRSPRGPGRGTIGGVTKKETPSGLDRRTLAKLAVLAGAGTIVAGPGSAARADTASTTLRLPAPSGSYQVGAVELYLIDRSRRDPWDASIPVRELMITVFYPAFAVRGFALAAQMTPGAAALFGELAPLGHPQLPGAGVDWAATMTHSRTAAPALPGHHPAVIYSPGGGDPRTLGTYTAEDLASHGYVVVTVDHPGDGCVVEFPTATSYRDRYRITVFRGDPRADAETYRTMIETRIADCAFVADALETLAAGGNPDALDRTLPHGLDRAIDPGRLAIYGHSAGGTTAAETAYEDARFAAAVNMEGYLDWTPAVPGELGVPLPVAEHGADRPTLLFGSGRFADERALDLSWSMLIARSGPRVARRQIADANHWAFTDFEPMAVQLEAAGLMSAAARDSFVGSVDPRIAVPEVRGLLRGLLECSQTSNTLL
jgi:dienelactone hydrolase